MNYKLFKKKCNLKRDGWDSYSWKCCCLKKNVRRVLKVRKFSFSGGSKKTWNVLKLKKKKK